MGFIVAAIILAAGSLGVGIKEGVFKKGFDTTRKDTYAFEKRALEMELARTETSRVNVVALESDDPSLMRKNDVLSSRERLLKERIAKIEKVEDEQNWEDE